MLIDVAFKHNDLSTTDKVRQWLMSTFTQKRNGQWKNNPSSVVFSFDGINWFGNNGKYGELTRDILDVNAFDYRMYKIFVPKEEGYNMQERALLYLGKPCGYQSIVTNLFSYVLSKDSITKLAKKDLAALEQVIKGVECGE